jgi:prepilin-type N-terminal cleavage/methylation domain-containing protein
MSGTPRDRGMTLVEMIIVVTLLGLISVVIAAVFTAVVRITPSTEYRIDDARSTRGLQTWLVRDIASTEPSVYDPAVRTGVVDGSYSSPGAAGVPAGDVCTNAGAHVLFMSWVDGGTTYRAQYTIEGDADGFEVVRTICGGDAGRQSLTGDVSSSPCTASPFSTLTTADADADGEIEAIVELCLVSTQTDSGLSAGGAQQEIRLSVASRNGDS